MRKIDRRRCEPGSRQGLLFQVQDYAFYARGEAHAWRRLAADLLDESVVSAAAHDGALAALPAWHDLEYRTSVVVQSSHQTVVQR
jgi:hypothetical protein